MRNLATNASPSLLAAFPGGRGIPGSCSWWLALLLMGGRMPYATGRSTECLTPTHRVPLMERALPGDRLSVGVTHSKGTRTARTVLHQKQDVPHA